MGLGLLLLVGMATANRRALLVGVDDYPWIASPASRLQGAATDVSLMARTLALYGFGSDALLRKQATRAHVVAGMERLVAGAKPGDEVVLYFSGRGSVAPDGEPVLVPADGTAAGGDMDLRMRRLEDWSTRIVAKGARPTIVLDASFVSPGRADFGRQYNPTPRCVVRPGVAVRPTLFKGPGLFFSACPAQGAAYEWLVDSAESRWAGAFTDAFTNALVAALNRGANPSYLDAMGEVQGYFKDKVRASYMPGLAPQPTMAAMLNDPARYGAAAFGGLDVAALPATSKLALAAAERLRQVREGHTRVAFETDDPRLRSSVEKSLKEFLKRVPKAEYAPTGEPPDVIFRVAQTPQGVESTVVGDDLDKERVYKFDGKDFKRTLDAGLDDYLALRAAVGRLYRLSEGGAPTWKANVRFAADSLLVARGASFHLNVETPEPALLFVLDRDDADGVVQLAFPQPGMPYPQKIAKAATLEAQAADDSSDGRMMLRAVLVPFAKAHASEVKSDEKEFRGRLLKQLQTLLPAMESGKSPWTARTVSLRIH